MIWTSRLKIFCRSKKHLLLMLLRESNYAGGGSHNTGSRKLRSGWLRDHLDTTWLAEMPPQPLLWLVWHKTGAQFHLYLICTIQYISHSIMAMLNTTLSFRYLCLVGLAQNWWKASLISHKHCPIYFSWY